MELVVRLGACHLKRTTNFDGTATPRRSHTTLIDWRPIEVNSNYSMKSLTLCWGMSREMTKTSTESSGMPGT